MATGRSTILTVAGSISLAFALWLYVSLTRTYEGDIMVPIVAVPPPEQTILSNVPKYVTVHVRTTGLQLLNMTYYNKPQVCTLFVAQMTSTGAEQYSLTNAELLSKLSDVVPSRMLATNPSELSITTGMPSTAQVPLKVVHRISVRPGFVLASPPTAETQSVTVRGMQSVVDSIKSWSTAKIFLDDAHESVVLETPVMDSLGTVLEVMPKTVRVAIDVQRLADQEIIDVPVKLVGGASGVGLSARPAFIRVTVRGGVDNIAQISRDDITAEIDAIPTSGFAIPKVRLAKNARVVGVMPRMLQIVRVAQ